MWYTLVILEYGIHPLPRCPKCDMFVPWKALNGKHQATAMCFKGAEGQLKQLREEGVQLITEVDFEDYRILLETVMAFKYLVRIITAPDDDWLEVVANLRKARK